VIALSGLQREMLPLQATQLLEMQPPPEVTRTMTVRIQMRKSWGEVGRPVEKIAVVLGGEVNRLQLRQERGSNRPETTPFLLVPVR
jgi:hypothetical protein